MLTRKFRAPELLRRELRRDINAWEEHRAAVAETVFRRNIVQFSRELTQFLSTMPGYIRIMMEKPLRQLARNPPPSPVGFAKSLARYLETIHRTVMQYGNSQLRDRWRRVLLSLAEALSTISSRQLPEPVRRRLIERLKEALRETPEIPINIAVLLCTYAQAYREFGSTLLDYVFKMLRSLEERKKINT